MESLIEYSKEKASAVYKNLYCNLDVYGMSFVTLSFKITEVLENQKMMKHYPAGKEVNVITIFVNDFKK